MSSSINLILLSIILCVWSLPVDSTSTSESRINVKKGTHILYHLTKNELLQSRMQGLRNKKQLFYSIKSIAHLSHYGSELNNLVTSNSTGMVSNSLRSINYLVNQTISDGSEWVQSILTNSDDISPQEDLHKIHIMLSLFDKADKVSRALRNYKKDSLDNLCQWLDTISAEQDVLNYITKYKPQACM